jgi:hypothetical protein
LTSSKLPNREDEVRDDDLRRSKIKHYPDTTLFKT